MINIHEFSFEQNNCDYHFQPFVTFVDQTIIYQNTFMLRREKRVVRVGHYMNICPH